MDQTTDQKVRCQSCGMPLGNFKDEAGHTVTNFGTHTDGSPSKEYCSRCFQAGHFTEPHLTLPAMIQLSVDNMTRDLGFPHEKASQLANEIIPSLRRWSLLV